jgi:hypothetical protein
MMRRRLRKFLPIVLMALMVQIFAPISACWAASIAISDPLSAAAICQDDTAAGQSDPSGTPRPHHDACCSLCCMAQAVVSIDTPQTTVATPYRHPEQLVWRDLTVERHGFRTGSHAQARAPPSIS